MNSLLIFYYDLIDDYVFCETVSNVPPICSTWYYFNDYNGKKFYLYFSPNMEYVCEVV